MALKKNELLPIKFNQVSSKADNIQFHEWVASKAEFQTPLKKNERTSFKMALL